MVTGHSETSRALPVTPRSTRGIPWILVGPRSPEHLFDFCFPFGTFRLDVELSRPNLEDLSPSDLTHGTWTATAGPWLSDPSAWQRAPPEAHWLGIPGSMSKKLGTTDTQKAFFTESGNCQRNNPFMIFVQTSCLENSFVGSFSSQRTCCASRE